MNSHRTQALLATTLAAMLGGCALASPARAPGPEAVSESSYRERNAPKKLTDTGPRTIAAWEARIQSHGALLYTLVHDSGGSGGSGSSGGAGGATAPPPAGPPSTGPTTPTRPYRPYRRSVRRRPASRQPTAGGATGTSATTRQSLRCPRISRTVRAICYAAKRICQIAARMDSPSARAACQRNRKICRSARNISARQGCIACGHAKRSQNRHQQTRRACIN